MVDLSVSSHFKILSCHYPLDQTIDRYYYFIVRPWEANTSPSETGPQVKGPHTAPPTPLELPLVAGNEST